MLATHVYGLGIDDLVQTRRGPPGFEQTYFFHADEQGTITAATDSSGAVVERYRYGDYGSVTILAPDGVTVRTTSVIANRHLYTGRLWLAEIGLYEYRHRYYDPNLGRFISRDPAGYAFGMNLYAYANSSPTDDVDPLGLFPPDHVMDRRAAAAAALLRPIAAAGAEFLQEHPRVAGGLQAVGGAIELSAGASVAVGTSPTIVGIGVGVGVAFHGADVTVAGLRQLVTGVPTQTLTAQALEEVSLTAEAAGLADMALSLGGTTFAMMRAPLQVARVAACPTSGALDTIAEGQRIAPYYPPNRGFAGTPVAETLRPGTMIDRFGKDTGR